MHTLSASRIGQEFTDQRYYAPGSGRFTTPHPSGVASVRPGNPGRWNRYMYVAGDPINRFAPPGLNEYSPDDDPFCLAEYESCEEWDWIVGIGGGKGGGGGAALVPRIGPGDIERERKGRLAAIILALSAALPVDQDPSQWQRIPAAIRKKDDCWQPDSSLSTTYTRVVTYEVLDEFGAPLFGSDLDGVSITEAFPMQNLGLKPATWSKALHSITGSGTFEDLLSAGGGLAGVSRAGEALQTFTARGSFGTIPLSILGFGQSDGVLYNTYSPSSVTIDGTTTTKQCSSYH